MKCDLKAMRPWAGPIVAAGMLLSAGTASYARDANELMMKAVGRTDNVSPVIVEAIKHAAMDLTPEQRKLALECWKNNVCETGHGTLTAAYADGGAIRFNVIKAGFVIGGSAGSGGLMFHGRRYPVSIGGISGGLVFGASGTHFFGTVSNIRSPWDVAGVYGAAGAGVAVGPGVSAIVLSNEKGAVLSMSGRQVGLIANLDLSGLAIALH